MTETPEYSSDARIEAVMGNREMEKNVVLYTCPSEEGYACPVHGPETEEELGNTLHFSEYNGFLWCEPCNKDYPSALCAIGNSYRHRGESAIDSQIRVYLDTVELAVARATAALQLKLDAVQAICDKAVESGVNIDPSVYDQGFADASRSLGSDLATALSDKL